MWTYRQSTGELFHNGALAGVGYSGHDACRNDPLKQEVPCQGPIPRGHYAIGEPFDSKGHGPFVLRLTPDATNEMFGRAGFLIHGDSVKAPGMASEGCIILSRTIRQAIDASGDGALEVIE